MPFDLPLSASLRKARWKVKIREKETREPPHVTILRGTDAWRIDLRNGSFMEEHPDPAMVPATLMDLIKDPTTWKILCDEWDRKYPANLVSATEDAGDEQLDDNKD